MRKRFFEITTFLIISFTIFVAISQQRKDVKKVEKESSSLVVEVPEGLDEKTFSMQAKLIISLIKLIESQDSIGKEQKESARVSLVESAQSYLETVQLKNSNPYLRAKQLIFAKNLGLNNDRICPKVVEKQESEIELFNQSLCNYSNAPELSEYDQNRLSWFYNYYKNPTKDIFTKKSLLKFSLGIGIVFLLILGSASLCLVLALYLIFGNPKKEFNSVGMSPDYCLEIFCLYLLGMNILPIVLTKSELVSKSNLNPLELNIIAIGSLSLLIFWPMFFGNSFKQVQERIGLYFVSVGRFLKDFILGFFSYWTSILPLLILLSLYSLVLVKFGVNVEQGAHPVVPIVASSKDSKTIWLIFILAVVIAPIIEEIMFRGAFYSWLRARFSSTVSILVSAIIFAAIHPQGAIGILPLGFIGVVLALIREYRGNITACIFAHACFNGGTLLLVLNAFR
jgi:membrane protease YdiL (CAAX protease family)